MRRRAAYFLPPFFFAARALISRSAASRAAARTSGFSLRFFASTSKEAPTKDRVKALLFTLRFFVRVLASMSCGARKGKVFVSLYPRHSSVTPRAMPHPERARRARDASKP